MKSAVKNSAKGFARTEVLLPTAPVHSAPLQRWIIGTAVAAALLLGYAVAREIWLGVALVAGVISLGLIARLGPPDALLGAGLLIGYLLGNRGFAQIHPPGLPLLPGEFVLGVAGTFWLWRVAKTRQLPLRRDPLHAWIIIWLLLGGLRLLFDFRPYGMLALRDSAMVYYAAFFFLGQAWTAQAVGRRWLERALHFGFALVAPMFLLFLSFGDWFASHLVVGGIPLVFFKSDVTGGLMVAGAAWWLDRYRREGRLNQLAWVAINCAGVGLSNSRAAMVAMLVLGAILVWRGAWRQAQVLVAIAGLGLVTLSALPLLDRSSDTDSPSRHLGRALLSVVDWSQRFEYEGTGLGDKPDNNRFRLAWWSAVVDETWAGQPWVGLGFGHDLAAAFLARYDAVSPDDLFARSPHSIVLSTFGRLGLIGAVTLAGILVVMARQTARAGRLAREGHDAGFGAWGGVWAIFVSACFGVVLEGPMGAVVFWTLLGIASERLHQASQLAAAEIDANGPAFPAWQPPAGLRNP